MTLGRNTVLGDRNIQEKHRPHRVALAHWPTTINDKRSASLEALIGHALTSGYEGFEIAVDGFMRYFPGKSTAVVAQRTKAALDKAGLRVFGATLHASDEHMRKRNWTADLSDGAKGIQDLGGQFVSYQLFLHPDYMDTGGAYRDDQDYLLWCADRIKTLREMTWDLGMNFYLEYHIQRMTEDPAACVRLLQMATCEINGDLSHMLARGITRGPHVETILKHMGHTHVRMARPYGDLSAVVEDPKQDWQAGGLTWQLFTLMIPGLDGGLSSRTIAGETGPMHLVKDALTQDANLVPLYRAMARYADAAAQGITMRVNEPEDLLPWG